LSRPEFKDHFSGHAHDYAAYRPSWPDELFRWLAQRAPGRRLAWDCATGNGQAAVSLAEYFDRVVATDASPEQLEQAPRHPRVHYRVEPAECCSLPDSSVDLVVVAQAFHWFDQAVFLNEANRVLRPGGLLALLIYQFATVSEPIDSVVDRLYRQILDGFWPAEREQVERGFSDLVLPFDEVTTPGFELNVDWNLNQLLNYLGTWSAVRRYRHSRGEDPIEQIRENLKTAWGSVEVRRRVGWPISLRVCRRPA
jgi:ubiquinone/menaquinone biosynthesis C-methylase UbiE